MNQRLNTGPTDRMSHSKRRGNKEQPSRARSGNQISCCLVSLHFLCDILSGRPVWHGNMLAAIRRRRCNMDYGAAKSKVYRQSIGSVISSYKVLPGVNIYYMVCPKVLPGVTNMLPGVTICDQV